MKKQVCITAAVLIAFLAVMALRAGEVEAGMEKTREALAEEVFRFHVVADSDRREDQEVKLKVRDAILQEMKKDMRGMDHRSAKATEQWAASHLREIEKTAEKVIREEGYAYGACARVGACYFPDKRYGDLLFPAGTYRALTVRLGEGRGQNWWCVLYPGLCFTDSVCAVVDKEGKKELREALTPEEYEMITASTKFKIKWFFFGGSWND
ncbi:stage II sporulation protein R [uncultured Merdimonas sp.]|uniref:stage II sporulation protein R n=1 Tax=uncultured Merdimonas sp. TaxID=2023269 RepID=UPI00320AD8FB